MFQTIGIVCKRHDPRVPDTVRELVRLLKAGGRQVVLDAPSADAAELDDIERMPRDDLSSECDLIVVVGGDGTFLDMAHSVDGAGVRMLGINLGRLGFLADISPEDMEAHLGPILDGEFQEDLRFMLDTQVRRGGRSVASLRALNEVVVHKHNIARLIEFETYIDGRLLNVQRSDGLIVSTPTGSTAYALSGGGPILHPNLDALVLVPICPHTLGARPIVLDSEVRVEIVIRGERDNGAELTGDGQSPVTLLDGDRIVVRRRGEPLHLVHPQGHDHFEVLRAKLHWAKVP